MYCYTRLYILESVEQQRNPTVHVIGEKDMKKTKLFTTTLILLTITLTQIALTQNVSQAVAASTSTATLLKIYAGPNSVPDDNRPYNIIVVQLQDGKGAPVRAKEDTTILLSSSLINVGTADPTVTIPKGSSTATANFYATYTPGTTTITAAASGYTTAQTSITTVGPIPSALALYGFPSLLPADGGTYNALAVQLQDSSGSPAQAPIEGVQVTLSSSNATRVAVDPSIIIEGGKTYAVASIKTTFNETGSASITAIASGYSSKQVTITTQPMNNPPTAVKVYLGPPKVPADGNTYEQVAVQLQNSAGKIARASEATVVTLSSSIEDVGIVEQTITIPQGESYATAKFSTTYRSGTTTITAAATSCTSSQASITTVGPIPSKLAVYCTPSALPADGKPYDILQVQLQDSRGKPAKDPLGNIIVNLFSSNPDAGNVSSALTLPFGETFSAGTFYTTCIANLATITAQASGYDPGQAKVTTYLIDPVFLTVSVTADSADLNPTNQTTIRAYVTYNGTGPALKASLNFTSDKGGNFSTPKEEGNGYYTTNFTAPKVSRQTVCTITANATKTGYQGTTDSVQITVALNSTLQQGILQLRVAEDNGDPVTEASITAQPQPTGSPTFNSLTNATGYAIFTNIPEGNYTLLIAKEGYETKTQTIQFTNNLTATQTVNLSKTASDSSLPLIIGAVAAAVIAALAVFLMIRKRRNARPPMQTQLQKAKRQKKEQNLNSETYQNPTQN